MLTPSVYIVLKRTIDIIGAITGLLIFAPVIIVFVIGIKLHSSGKALYAQQRVGMHNQPFTIYKLRTMHMDGDERLKKLLDSNENIKKSYHQDHCLTIDPRIAGPWALLARRYSIDELPQFINVLIGNMSLVGPRPLSQNDMNTFISTRSHRLKLSVKPGMTGLWQVSRKGKHEIAKTMEKFDLEYVKSPSLLTDIFILLKTVRAVMSGGGQY